MKLLKTLIFLLILNAPTTGIAGNVYYVDPTQNDPAEDGSYNHPWNSLADVNGHKFSNGDDVYFKAGTKLTARQSLRIDWHGSKSDRVVIGAYYGRGLFGLGGKAKPVIDGQGKIPSDVDFGLIHHTGPGHITVQDLHVKNSYGIGICLKEIYQSPAKSSMNNIVKGCLVKESGRQGILFVRNTYGLIEQNFIDGTSQRQELLYVGKLAYSGAAIEVNGMNNESVSQHNTIRGNTVRRNVEGIGIYKGARYTLIENNTVYDMAGNGIYAANARDGIIRNNLVYGINPYDSHNHLQPERGRRQLIWIDVEGHVTSIIKVTGGWKIYGNYLAGGATGIWLQSNGNDIGVYQTNNKIYNNRIVDCNRNIWIHQSVQGWKGNEIYNNYSFIFTPNLVHINGSKSPVGVSWSGNYYNSVVSGNAADNAIFNMVSLSNSIDWRNLPYGKVTTSFFDINGDNSVKTSNKPNNLKIIKIEN